MTFRLLLLTGLVWIAGRGLAEAQLGALVSPGALTRPHAALEGIANCQKCHEQGRRITAAKCLSCHQPVADRIARKIGVHRDVKDDCVTCHVEHSGVNGELRPFDQRAFDHGGVARFPLEGKHAALAARCAACHKTRSFLTAGATCQSCHADVHKGTLGTACDSCHTTRVAFKDVVAGGRFDHAKSAFPLAGAHKAVQCTACHANGVFKGLAFSSCASCHKDPHQPALGAACTTCHTVDSWKTTKVDHSRTTFPLLGRHTTVACTSCHKQSPMKTRLASTTCAACHVDVHRGSFKQDCRACHSESGFGKTPFDHTQTRFTLAGKHAGLACDACHKGVLLGAGAASSRPVDFRGLQTTCISCHADVHRGELGAACESCHSAQTFKVTTYTHTRFQEFFGGRHAPLACGQCHRAADAPTGGPAVLNVKFRDLSTACVSCHVDVHLGQVGTQCQSCHTLQSAKFAVTGFNHTTPAFPLTGKHQTTACEACHKPETGAFPAGAGTAVRLKGLGVECRACHQDVHLGQMDNRCESCHTTQTFKLPEYQHRNARALRDFFAGRHAAATCAACHTPATRDFPGGRGTAMAFAIDTRCTACHRDIHNGAMPNCQGCHKP